MRGEQTLGELGLDSLGLVALGLALEEKTGKAVADADLRLEMTVAEVRTLLAQAPGVDGEGRAEGGARAAASGPPPLWPYTWGRAFRALSFPWDLLYRLAVTRTVVLGREHLAHLPSRVILAGTHHSFADMPLVRRALAQTAARRLSRRLVIATAGEHLLSTGLVGRYGILAFGLYPLRQHAGQEESLRGLARLASAGSSVLIFPQGIHVEPERERAGDPTARFRPGVAHLAAALDVPVVPFGLAGTETIIPGAAPADFKGYVIAGIPVSLRRGPLAVAFGAPLVREPGESPQAFTARLQEICFALTRQAEQALAPARDRTPAVAVR